jgi:hypothetical protein
MDISEFQVNDSVQNTNHLIADELFCYDKHTKARSEDGYPVASSTDPKFVCARRLKYEKFEKLYIRMNGGTLYDPLDISHLNNYNKTTTGLPVWEMQPVNGEKFYEYLQYLKTGNKTCYNKARDVISVK